MVSGCERWREAGSEATAWTGGDTARQRSDHSFDMATDDQRLPRWPVGVVEWGGQSPEWLQMLVCAVSVVGAARYTPSMSEERMKDIS